MSNVTILPQGFGHAKAYVKYDSIEVDISRARISFILEGRRVAETCFDELPPDATITLTQLKGKLEIKGARGT